MSFQVTDGEIFIGVDLSNLRKSFEAHEKLIARESEKAAANPPRPGTESSTAPKLVNAISDKGRRLNLFA